MDKFIEAKHILENHGVVAFPTETVCGLGVIFDDEIAFEKLNQVKGRPENKPYTLMLSNTQDIDKYAYVDEEVKKVINAFMPGPITLLLKRKADLPFWVTRGSDKIGIRVPDDEVTLKLISTVGKPLLVPSANKSGEKPAMDIDETKKIFGSEVDYYIDGKAGGAKPSTIVDMYDSIKVVRQGDITLEEIMKVIGGK